MPIDSESAKIFAEHGRVRTFHPLREQPPAGVAAPIIVNRGTELRFVTTEGHRPHRRPVPFPEGTKARLWRPAPGSAIGGRDLGEAVASEITPGRLAGQWGVWVVWDAVRLGHIDVGGREIDSRCWPVPAATAPEPAHGGDAPAGRPEEPEGRPVAERLFSAAEATILFAIGAALLLLFAPLFLLRWMPAGDNGGWRYPLAGIAVMFAAVAWLGGVVAAMVMGMGGGA